MTKTYAEDRFMPEYEGTKRVSKTVLYTYWIVLRQKTTNRDYTAYHLFGAKGLGLCKAWVYNYLAFREWALRNGYRDGMKINRNDARLPYTPENTSIGDPATMVRIHHNPKWVTKEGVAWVRIARENGIAKPTFVNRVRNLKWPPKDAATLPVGTRRAI